MNGKILAMEWIGLQVKVHSKDKNKQGLKGRIVDETKNCFIIETSNGEKKIAKREASFEVQAFGKRFLVSGRLLEARPAERIKLFAKKFG